jgi:hypothetical protein
MVHLSGEDGPGFHWVTLGGTVTVERTAEALTPHGGLAAWSAFVRRLGIIEGLAERYPGQRTSSNAAPVREVLHSFKVMVLIEERRFSHVGWVRDDPGVAAVLGLERVRGEDALPRLMRPLSAEQARAWLRTAESALYRGLGRDGQHALRQAGRSRSGLQPLQARSAQSSSLGLRGGGHGPVFAHGVAAWQSGQCHGLARGDGTALGSRRNPVPPMAQPRRERLRPGAGVRVVRPPARNVRNIYSNCG